MPVGDEEAFEEIREPHSKYSLHEFELYNLARDFRQRIYGMIKTLPEHETRALVPQMRKAAISVSNNIAEAHGRWHIRETMQFCRIARGSVEEIIDDVNICRDEKYHSQTLCEETIASAYHLIHKINGYVSYLHNRK